MAEAAGLAVGIVGLAVSLKACIDLFDCFYAAWKHDHDYTILVVKLNIEKALLLQWAQRSGLIKRIKANRSDDSDKFATALPILNAIKDLLSDGQKLQARYGVTKLLPHERSTSDYQPCVIPIANSRIEKLDKALGRLSLYPTTTNIAPGGKPLSKIFSQSKLRWGLHDKEKFASLITELSYFVSGLRQLFPCTDSQAKQMFVEDMFSVKATSIGQCVQEATNEGIAGEETPQATAAREHVNRLIQERILDCLWFRRIHDRYIALSPPNPGTFEWVLAESAAPLKWHNLPTWLRDDSKSLYWVCGKAASGKSTLMKFIYNHDKTLRFLESWASGCVLHTASFFFFDLGTEDQKSQHGLFRGLLHDILAAHPDLIADLLPEMWREARMSDDALTLPSQAEIKSAFQQLAKPELQNHRYCLFIDGLDEFSGNAVDAVDIIRMFSTLPNVKVMMSSRPITACTQAFSSHSRLNLEDLTRNDMMEYTDQRLGSHTYLSILQKHNTQFMHQLRTELVKKASGVFLWLSLVCRTLLEGFNNCDNLETLKRRIDELPAELGLLFEHMFGKISRPYQLYAFRMLEICRAHYRFQINLPIYTVGLALADSHDLDSRKIAGVHPRDEKDDFAQSVILRERLRARCCGLIELVLFPPLECDYDSLDEDGLISECLKCEENALVASKVEFVHRSLLEYMGTEAFASFQRRMNWNSGSFNAEVALTCIIIHETHAYTRLSDSGVDVNEEDLFNALIGCIRATSCTGGSHVSFALDELLGFLDIWMKAPDYDLSKELPRNTARSHMKLVLAAEIGARDLFHSLWIEAGRPSLRNLTAGRPILCHAVHHPLLNAMNEKSWSPIFQTQVEVELVRYLLSAGCDPNELIMPIPGEGDSTTTWQGFIENIEQEIQDAGDDLALAELFLSHGASVEDARNAILRVKEGNMDEMEPTYRAFWQQFCQLVDKFEWQQAEAAAVATAAASLVPEDAAVTLGGECVHGTKRKRRGTRGAKRKKRASA